MAESTEWDFQGERGKLVGRTWVGDAPPDHVVLIAHGYGEHVGRYERLADALVANGAVVYAVDHIGHGKSDGERVLVEDSFEAIVTDLHTVDARARAEHPELPVVLLGHSMGGLIGARYAQRYGGTLRLLILSSPVLGRWDVVEDTLALDEIPDVPLDVSTLSRDPEVGELYTADPLIWHGPFKRPTLLALRETLRTINDGRALGDLPALWIHGDADQLVPIDGTREGIERIQSDSMEEHIYPGGRHELFNEINSDEVTADVIEFINQGLGRA